MTTVGAVDLEAIRRARETAAGVAKHTPVVSSVTLSETVGGTVALKAENLQRTGSFKIRGAMNKLASLAGRIDIDGGNRVEGVTAGSAGNHAQAIAFAAQHFGLGCEIFVPAGASIGKIEACLGFGATVNESGASLMDAVEAAKASAAATGWAFCHPFDDPIVVAGQGALGLELLDDIADLALVIVPIGGGGLAAGTAIAIKSISPAVHIVGVQAAVCAPYSGQAAPVGAVATLADGIAVKTPGAITRPLIEHWIDEIVTVDEESIADAMVLLMERAKLYVEGAGAVGVAALLAGRVVPAPVGTTCVVLSGGNVDLGVVPGLIRRHENAAGRRLTIFATIDDRPGGMAQLLTAFAGAGANLIEVDHVREMLNLRVRETGVQATFEVRSPQHAEQVVEAVREAGYEDLRQLT
ncbi:MAG TPA: pyridoxal-phosphate dependent enzyme [Ilumatobacteraceae bacterium]|nr:pyridoxal-phosphate dependent enzyme [Ilumatobacteraceae bacterium]